MKLKMASKGVSKSSPTKSLTRLAASARRLIQVFSHQNMESTLPALIILLLEPFGGFSFSSPPVTFLWYGHSQTNWVAANMILRSILRVSIKDRSSTSHPAHLPSLQGLSWVQNHWKKSGLIVRFWVVHLLIIYFFKTPSPYRWWTKWCPLHTYGWNMSPAILSLQKWRNGSCLVAPSKSSARVFHFTKFKESAVSIEKPTKLRVMWNGVINSFLLCIGMSNARLSTDILFTYLSNFCPAFLQEKAPTWLTNKIITKCN